MKKGGSFFLPPPPPPWQVANSYKIVIMKSDLEIFSRGGGGGASPTNILRYIISSLSSHQNNDDLCGYSGHGWVNDDREISSFSMQAGAQRRILHFIFWAFVQ